MIGHNNAWAWKPDSVTKEAILRGNMKVRRTESQARDSIKPKTSTKEIAHMAKKTKTKGPAKAGKKLDGKKLAAARKPRDSVAQFIKDELLAGKTDVEKIVERAKKEFPKTKPTNGYVRWLAKQVGKEKAVARVPAEKSKKSVDPAS